MATHLVPHAFPPPAMGAGDPSLLGAVTRVLDVSERLVLDQIAVVRFEAQERLGATIRRLAIRTGAVVLLAHAWILLLAGISVIATRHLPLETWLIGLGALHALLGVGFWMLGRDRTRASAEGSSR